MSPAWLSSAAEEMWSRVSVSPEPMRDPERLARYGFHAPTLRFPRLTVALVRDWCSERSIPGPGDGDRALRGCLVITRERPFIFLDGGDPEDEQRCTLAHELAHLWLEVIHPRERAAAAAGSGAGEVLSGLRPPTAVERWRMLWERTPMRLSFHLMERDPARGLLDPHILQVERRADELALELLAPAEEVIRVLPPRCAWGVWQEEAAERIRATYGLPRSTSQDYARRLAPHVGAGPSMWERIAGK